MANDDHYNIDYEDDWTDNSNAWSQQQKNIFIQKTKATV